VIAGGVFTAWRWVMRQYFVGAQDGSVAIFHGIPDDVGPVRLSSVDEVLSDIPVTDLPQYSRERVRNGIVADTHDQALTIVDTLREQAAACRAATSLPTTIATPTATGTATPAATRTGSTTPSRAATSPRPTGAAATSPGATASLPTTAPTTSPTTTPGNGIVDCGGLNR